MDFVYSKLADINEISISKNYPVFFVNKDKIADYLFEKNILITSFYYPATPLKVNRIVLNANHTKMQLEQLVTAILQFVSQ